MTDQQQAQGSTQGEFFAEPYEAMDLGAYEAKLSRIFTPAKDGPFGPSREWYFEILDPDYEGKELKVFSSQAFSPQSKPRQFVEALLGRKVEEGERFSFDDLVGKRCMIHIGHKTTDRGTFETVEAVTPIRQGKRKGQPTKPEPVEVTEEDTEEGPPF